MYSFNDALNVLLNNAQHRDLLHDHNQGKLNIIYILRFNLTTFLTFFLESSIFKD